MIFTLLALALAPGVAIILFIYLKDKHEKEPKGLLFRAFIFGILSLVLTLVVSSIADTFVALDHSNSSDLALHAFGMVALIEEGSKYLFVRFFLYPHKEFNEPFDGIIYAVMVSMGFATVENLFYVFDGGVGIAIMRMFTAVPAHATFAVLMGFFLGKAKFQHKKAVFGLIGLVAATVLHGAYDYFLFMDHVPGIWLGALVSLIVGLYLSKRAIKMHQEVSPFKPLTGL
jgi:protease PrsW